MKQHAAVAEEQFQAFAKSQAEDWEKQRESFEKAWTDIADGFTRAWSRFK